MAQRKCGNSSGPSTDVCEDTRVTVMVDMNETILCSSWWSTEMRIGDKIEHKESMATWTVMCIYATVIHPKSRVRDHTFEFDENVSLIKWSESGYDLVAESALCQDQDKKMTRIRCSILDGDYQPYIHSLSDLEQYNSFRPSRSPISFVCNGYVVRLRPYLCEFMEYICESFRVILFTGPNSQMEQEIAQYMQLALRQYCEKVPKFDQILLQSSCDAGDRNERLRESIHELGVPRSRLLIVSGREDFYWGFKENSIGIGPFYGHVGRNEELRQIRYGLMDIDEYLMEVFGA